MSTYHRHDYQGAAIYVDQKIDDPEATIEIRVNPYRQNGKITFRALRLDFKETIRNKA